MLGYRAADLRLCFRIYAKSRFSEDADQTTYSLSFNRPREEGIPRLILNTKNVLVYKVSRLSDSVLHIFWCAYNVYCVFIMEFTFNSLYKYAAKIWLRLNLSLALALACIVHVH